MMIFQPCMIDVLPLEGSPKHAESTVLYNIMTLVTITKVTNRQNK